jgi:hypothetical protein
MTDGLDEELTTREDGTVELLSAMILNCGHGLPSFLPDIGFV